VVREHLVTLFEISEEQRASLKAWCVECVGEVGVFVLF
jgi:hypothetical protein